MAPWCNPLTLQPEQSGGVGSSPCRPPPLERHDKGSRTRLGLLPGGYYTYFGKIRLKSLLVLRTRENHPTLRKSANGIAASSPLRQNQSFDVKFLVPSQKLKWMLKYCSYLKYFLINQLQRYPSRVVYMFRQISYLGPELRAFSGQENLTFLRKFI